VGESVSSPLLKALRVWEKAGGDGVCGRFFRHFLRKFIHDFTLDRRLLKELRHPMEASLGEDSSGRR
jgi:hypothetical protein